MLDVVGKGVQIYHCKPSTADPNVLTWTFREPAVPCDPATDATLAVPYRARSVFYAG